MARRKIPLEWLDSVLASPQQRIPELGGKEIFQSLLTTEDGTLYLLRVVLATEQEPPVGVTVYRTSKVEKYWRPE